MPVNYKLKSSTGKAIQIRPPNQGAVVQATSNPNLRCPHCMHMGAFSTVIPHDFVVQHTEPMPSPQRGFQPAGQSTIGLRSCPNPECRGLVLVVIDGTKSTCLPPEVLDFDATDIPPAIAASLEEAVKCHSAQCYKAAALMVRRVLEELCSDRNASGDNLAHRLKALASTIVVPTELISAADRLRLLGNDAAHIEAKTYETIGEPEVRIAIDLTKELLKATYQYKGLLGRLAALEKPA